MLDALVDWQDRNIAGPGEPPCVEKRLQVAQHRRVAIRVDPDTVDEIGAGQMQEVFRNRLAFVLQQSLPFLPDQLFNLLNVHKCFSIKNRGGISAASGSPMISLLGRLARYRSRR